MRCEMCADITLPPSEWTKDELSKFIALTHGNLFATFHEQKNCFNVLKDIDGCYLRIALHLTNPQNLLVPFFLYRSHSAYRAACATSMCGQAVETFVLLRSCLEFAGYALLIHNKPELGELWLDRHQNEEAKKKGKQEFQIKEFRAILEKQDKKLAEIFQMFYERTIDFGAHPNERSITGNMKIEEGEDQTKFIQIYMHADGMEMLHALKSTAEMGLCCLHVFQRIYSERFSLLGLNDELIKLRSRVDGLATEMVYKSAS